MSTTFAYPSLPGPNLTRMIHLLPSKNTNAPIECILFNYDLSEGSGGVHIYEALSYCWESNVRSELVTINGCPSLVTKNLYTALLYLRDHQLKRTLWVDAICINQDDLDEKQAQIPLMRGIYAQAGQVIVWLGEDRDGGDKALEGIQCIASQDETTESMKNLRDISGKLLQRDWFCRVWVLQEVGVARSVSIVCGSIQISGHAFCEGLSRLGLPPSIQTHINPVTYLINGASFRPRREIAPQGALPIAELMSMYSEHCATVQHDRIYALLGLSSDAQSSALQPDYRLPWYDVFKNALRHIFPECSIQTHRTGIAVIQGKAWILGHVHSVTQGNSSFGGQHTISVVFNKVARSLGYHEAWEDEWRIQPTVDLVQEGDVISLFPGASRPNIVRLCNDHFTVISAAVVPRQLERDITPNTDHDMTGLRDTLLTWSFASGDAETEPEESRPSLIQKIPGFQELPDELHSRTNQIISVILDVAIGTEKDPEERWNSKALKQILDQSGIHALIIELFRIATQDPEVYGNAFIEVLTQQEGEGGLVSEEVVKAAARNDGDYGPIFMELLFKCQGQSLPVSEQVVHEAVANSGMNARHTVKCLLEQQCLVVSEEVLKIAARNQGNDDILIMEELLKGREQGFLISEEVLQVAAANDGLYADKIMTMLLEQQEQEHNCLISEETVRIAAANHGDRSLDILNALLERQDPEQGFLISEEVLQAATANNSIYAYEIMTMLLNQREQEHNCLISEEVLKIAAANNGMYAKEIMTMLLEKREQKHNYLISEDVLQIAAANGGSYADKIMTMLLEQQEQEHNCLISEEVLKIVVANHGYGSSDLLTVLLERQEPAQVCPISEEILKAAATGNNPHAFELMTILLKRQEQEQEQGLQISEEILKAAATNNGMYANYLMSVLFEQGGPEQVRLVSEEVLKLVAANTGCRTGEMMSDILERLKPDQSRLVTQEVLKIAAANPEGGRFFGALLKHVKNDVAVPEEVVMIAAANTGEYGYGVMKSILDHQGEGFLVSEEVLKEAAVNTGEFGYIIMMTILEEKSLVLSEEVVKEVTKNANWEDMFDALFSMRGEDVPLTEDVIKAAAENIGEDETRMMGILRKKRRRIANKFWEGEDT